MTNQQQTPRQNVEERLGEAGPTMFFPRMIETVHLNRQRRNHRRQLEHDRAAQAAVLRGEQPPEWSVQEEGDDEMGDSFSIAGDTHVYQQPPPSPQPQAPPPQRSNLADMVKGGLITAALASVPAAAGIGYYLANRPQQVQSAPQTQPQQEQKVPWWLSPGYKVHPPKQESE